jgi:outer membrane protein OmpA-like peptidoglycan-associated protein
MQPVTYIDPLSSRGMRLGVGRALRASRTPGRRSTCFLLVPLAASCCALACATPAVVADLTSRVEVGPPVDADVARASELDESVGELQTIANDQDLRLDAAVTLATLAEERVAEAEEMARGDLSYDVVFALDDVPFAPGSSELGDGARLLLDQLAERLLAENVGRYIEVHGRGDAAWGGQALARRRADAIRRYLHLEHGLPLFRITTLVSRADGAPTAGGTAAGAASTGVVVLAQASP